ncbi:MAG TPA: SNF2-related protein, partial [Balneolales bacterium]|nr:SNF2-related protein [Balneolales bacterium]
QINYRKPSGDLFVNPIVIGAYIKISEDEEYLFDEKSYNLLNHINAFNTECEHLDRSDRLALLGQIKNDLKSANRSQPQELKDYDIVPLEKFTAILEEHEDGSVSVIPVPLKGEKKIDQDGNENIVYTSVLSEKEQEDFKSDFKKGRKARKQYLLANRKVLVYQREKFKSSDDGENDVLSQFKNLQKLTGEKKKAFFKEPQNFLNQDFVELSELSERVKEIGQYTPTVLPFIPKSDNDWFPEEGGVIIDGDRVKIPPENRDQLIEELKEALKEGKDTVEFKGIEYPANDETIRALENLKKASEQSRNQKSDNDDLTGSEKTPNTILIIRDNYFEVEDFFGKKNVHEGKPGLPIYLKKGINLYPHQKDGLNWLQSLWMRGEQGALLADDMGLGKTLQALLFAAWIREQTINSGGGPTLIIAPLTLLENWRSEYEQFLEWESFNAPLILHGSLLSAYRIESNRRALGIRNEREIDADNNNVEELIRKNGGLLLDISKLVEADMIITTYETIRDYQFSLSHVKWSLMVLDEIQKIKNPEALVSKAVKAMNYEFGLGLTGTPVENSWIDLWSIIDFVQPGRLNSLTDFNNRYQKKLDDPEIDVEKLGLQLQNELGSTLRRRMKEDHLNGLPNREIKPIHVELTDLQKKRYQEIKNEANNPDNETFVLPLLRALSDVCLCPYLPYTNEHKLLDIDSNEIIESSAKIKKVIEILDSIKSKDEKAIIFLISRKMQAVLQGLIIEKYGFRPFIINGTVNGG